MGLWRAMLNSINTASKTSARDLTLTATLPIRPGKLQPPKPEGPATP